MKKLTMILSLVVLFAFTASAYAQTKGETDVTIGGDLFKNTNKSIGTSFSPNVMVGYYFMDKIRLDAGLGYNKAKGGDAGIPIMIGARYSYYAKDKMRINGGLDLNYGLGKGNVVLDDKAKAVNPMSLKITLADAEYWPMEGGALTAGLFYSMNNLNVSGGDSGSFGVGLGVLVRFK